MLRDVPGSAGEALAFPPLFSRWGDAALGVVFMLVLLFPLAASVDTSIAPVHARLDAGAVSVYSRVCLEVLIFIGAVFMMWLPSSRQCTTEARERHRVVLALAFFLGMWGLAACRSVCVPDSFSHYCLWLGWALFLGLCRRIARTRASFEMAVHCVLAVGLLVTGMCLESYLEGASASSPALTGAFNQADVAAGYLLLLLPLAVGLLVTAQRWDQKVFYGGTAVSVSTALVLTYSRGGQLAALCAVAAITIVWVRSKRFWRAILTALLVFGIGFALAGLLSSHGQSLIPSHTIARTRQLVSAVDSAGPHSAGAVADSSVTARLVFYRGAVRMLVSRPFLGWGPGTFGRVFPRYQDDVRFYSRYTHDEYLALAAEGGLLSLASFVAFLLCLGYVVGRRCLVRSEG